MSEDSTTSSIATSAPLKRDVSPMTLISQKRRLSTAHITNSTLKSTGPDTVHDGGSQIARNESSPENSSPIQPGRRSIIDWDSFINLPKKNRRLSLTRRADVNGGVNGDFKSGSHDYFHATNRSHNCEASFSDNFSGSYSKQGTYGEKSNDDTDSSGKENLEENRKADANQPAENCLKPNTERDRANNQDMFPADITNETKYGIVANVLTGTGLFTRRPRDRQRLSASAIDAANRRDSLRIRKPHQTGSRNPSSTGTGSHQPIGAPVSRDSERPPDAVDGTNGRAGILSATTSCDSPGQSAQAETLASSTLKLQQETDRRLPPPASHSTRRHGDSGEQTQRFRVGAESDLTTRRESASSIGSGVQEAGGAGPSSQLHARLQEAAKSSCVGTTSDRPISAVPAAGSDSPGGAPTSRRRGAKRRRSSVGPQEENHHSDIVTATRKNLRRRNGDGLPVDGEGGGKAFPSTPSLNSPRLHQSPVGNYAPMAEAGIEKQVTPGAETDKSLHFSFSQLNSLGSDKDAAMAISNLLMCSGKATPGKLPKSRRSLLATGRKQPSVPTQHSPFPDGRKSEGPNPKSEADCSKIEILPLAVTPTPTRSVKSHGAQTQTNEERPSRTQRLTEQDAAKPPAIVCPDCGIVFAAKKNLVRHHRKLRCKGTPAPPRKPVIKKKTPQKKAIKRHHGEPLNVCPDCTRVFSAKKSLVRHQKQLRCQGLRRRMLHIESADPGGGGGKKTQPGVTGSMSGPLKPSRRKWRKAGPRVVYRHRRGLHHTRGTQNRSSAPHSSQPDPPPLAEVVSSPPQQSSAAPVRLPCPGCDRTFKSYKILIYHRRFRCTGGPPAPTRRPAISGEYKILRARNRQSSPSSGQQQTSSQRETADDNLQTGGTKIGSRLSGAPRSVEQTQNRARLRHCRKSLVATPLPSVPQHKLDSFMGETVIESVDRPRPPSGEVAVEAVRPLPFDSLAVAEGVPMDGNRRAANGQVGDLTCALDSQQSTATVDTVSQPHLIDVKHSEQTVSDAKVDGTDAAGDGVKASTSFGEDAPQEKEESPKTKKKGLSRPSAGSPVISSLPTSTEDTDTADKDTTEAGIHHLQSDVTVANKAEDEVAPAAPHESVELRQIASPMVEQPAQVDCENLAGGLSQAADHPSSSSDCVGGQVEFADKEPEPVDNEADQTPSPLPSEALTLSAEASEPVALSQLPVDLREIPSRRVGRPRRGTIRLKTNAKLLRRKKYRIGASLVSASSESADSTRYEYSCNLDKHLPRLHLRRKAIANRLTVRNHRGHKALAKDHRCAGGRQLILGSPTSSTATEPETMSAGGRIKAAIHSGDAEDTQSTASDLTTVTSLSAKTIPARVTITTPSSQHPRGKSQPTYLCPGCRRGGFLTYRAALSHRNSCRSGARTRLPSVPEQQPEQQQLFACSYCGRQHKSIIGLRVHRAACARRHRAAGQVTRKPPTVAVGPAVSTVGLLCPGCGPKSTVTFASTEAILTHLHRLKASTHPSSVGRPLGWPAYLSVPNLGFGCHICGLLLASESRLDKHKRAQHEVWLRREANVSSNGGE